MTVNGVIIEGAGFVEIDDLPPEEVNPGDVVIIPPGSRQRINNTGSGDLVFLALCSPRFSEDVYEGLDG